MAGVDYQVYDFPTSPAPTVVMFSGPQVPGRLPAEVKGILVHRQADALFFLMAARIDRQRSPDEIKQGKQFELARFVIHYQGGQKVDMLLFAEVTLGNYRQKTPGNAVPGRRDRGSRPFQQRSERRAISVASVEPSLYPDLVPILSLIAARSSPYTLQEVHREIASLHARHLLTPR
jgi:hypothetical protein